MSAAEKEVQGVKVTSCMASEQPWVQCADGFQIKVLCVDEARHTAEALFKVAPGHNAGRHKHTCETSVYVLEGRIRNLTTGVEFGPGDYCYQPYNDVHEEEVVEELIAFVNYRGDQDKFVEFYDENGEVCGEFKLSDFVGLLPQ